MDKKCMNCKWYYSCYNSNERYNEEYYKEEITKTCEDYEEDNLKISEVRE